jgi:putative FmdB family regulatory protein
MPLYEYRCAECGKRFEILQRLGQGADGLTCPTCGASQLEKQYSTFASAGGTTQDNSSGGGCNPGGFC